MNNRSMPLGTSLVLLAIILGLFLTFSLDAVTVAFAVFVSCTILMSFVLLAVRNQGPFSKPWLVISYAIGTLGNFWLASKAGYRFAQHNEFGYPLLWEVIKFFDPPPWILNSSFGWVLLCLFVLSVLLVPKGHRF